MNCCYAHARDAVAPTCFHPAATELAPSGTRAHAVPADLIQWDCWLNFIDSHSLTSNFAAACVCCCCGARAVRASVVHVTHGGRRVSAPRRGHHFLHIDDFKREHINEMLERGADAKRRMMAARLAPDKEPPFEPLKGKTAAMVFQKPSLRTRVSFETVRVAHSKHLHAIIMRLEIACTVAQPAAAALSTRSLYRSTHHGSSRAHARCTDIPADRLSTRLMFDSLHQRSYYDSF